MIRISKAEGNTNGVDATTAGGLGGGALGHCDPRRWSLLSRRAESRVDLPTGAVRGLARALGWSFRIQGEPI